MGFSVISYSPAFYKNGTSLHPPSLHHYSLFLCRACSSTQKHKLMTSDDTMTLHSSMHDEDEDVDDVMDMEHDQHCYNLSRLSVCSRNGHGGGDDDDDEDDEGTTVMPQLSLLSVDEDWEREADGELSDGKEEGLNASDHSDKEKIATTINPTGDRGWLSLPSTPRRKFRRQLGGVAKGKEYASENDARSGEVGRRRRSSEVGRRRRSQSRRSRERWLERAWEMKKCRSVDEEFESGDSECVAIDRPKGGGKSLCMDLEEVKACFDLGFNLQRQWTIEIPSRVSPSTVDTDSGSNSPIANWRISSPGDDPRDVKARLKVWAQAVALASASYRNA